jgi:hypothetical protein
MVDRSEWDKFKTSVQKELCEILVELERLGLEKPAAAIRRVGVSPENNFGTGNEWHYVVWETANEMSSAADVPRDLRIRLQQLSVAVDPRPKQSRS